MTRVVVRMLLTALLVPAMIVGGSLTGAFLGEFVFPSREDSVAVGTVTACCVGYALGYWLIWRGVVAWTRRRVVRTLLVYALFAGLLLLADAIAYFASGGDFFNRFPWILLVNFGLLAAWLITASLVWTESPRERAARIGAAATSSTLCPACKYDLAGLSNLKCPECGNEFTLGRFQDEQRRRTAPGGLD